MAKTQTSSTTSTGLPPRISMFDKRGQANLSKFTKVTNMPQNKDKVVLPTVRINQHKGA